MIDPTWLGRLVEVVDPPSPWIDLRAFPSTERDGAMPWISEEEGASQPPKGLRIPTEYARPAMGSPVTSAKSAPVMFRTSR